uniref:Coiled-coil-helix-coiled-coil-helix domain-containing protein 7 n=1 Tax=Gopherus agassizii TaxID=38772 RepID=A0A452I561_9SAUR
MSRNVQRLRDHDTNPCLAETDASRQCMDDNNYRKDMCASYFLKYKNCRKFWVSRLEQNSQSNRIFLFNKTVHWLYPGN